MSLVKAFLNRCLIAISLMDWLNFFVINHALTTHKPDNRTTLPEVVAYSQKADDRLQFSPCPQSGALLFFLQSSHTRKGWLLTYSQRLSITFRFAELIMRIIYSTNLHGVLENAFNIDLLCYSPFFDVIADTMLMTERNYFFRFRVKKLPVLRICRNFFAIIHSTKNDTVNKTNLF